MQAAYLLYARWVHISALLKKHISFIFAVQIETFLDMNILQHSACYTEAQSKFKCPFTMAHASSVHVGVGLDQMVIHLVGHQSASMPDAVACLPHTTSFS
jgi:hypothetical protein